MELRDNDANRYGGNGVLQAVSNINSVLAPQLIGLCPDDLSMIDSIMIAIDGTPEKGNLGANAILALSMATARVISEANGHNDALWEFLSCGNPVTLPVPMLNILNGGRHASNSTDIQEFMVLPIGFDTFSEALRCGVEIYQSLKNILRDGGYNLNVGDEGGFAPSLNSNREAIELVLRSVETAGYLPGKQVFFGLDVAASELFDESDNTYVLDREGRSLTSDELISLYSEWVSEYPILSIEDGLDEDDWDGWVRLTEKLGNKVQLVGDDLFVTNISRIEKGEIARAGNSVLLKPNQIGTITETLQALERTRSANWGAVMSHRSGETEDSIIADLAVGWNVGQIKAGAPARSDRVAKYNRLLRIEQSLGDQARYMGRQAYGYLGSGISN